jgi:hypothetical protein
MSNVMLFFSNFLDTCEDRLLLSFSQKDGEEMTITTTFYNGDEIKYQPFVVRGTIDDLAKESGYWAEIKKFKDEIIPRFSSLADLEKEIEETEKKYNEKLKKANKIPDVKKGRCSGAFDQEIVNRLLVAPINDDAYPKILESANLQTILEVLPLISDTQDKKRFNKVSAELKKVTGAGAEEQGIMYEKAVENKQPALF